MRSALSTSGGKVVDRTSHSFSSSNNRGQSSRDNTPLTSSKKETSFFRSSEDQSVRNSKRNSVSFSSKENHFPRSSTPSNNVSAGKFGASASFIRPIDGAPSSSFVRSRSPVGEAPSLSGFADRTSSTPSNNVSAENSSFNGPSSSFARSRNAVGGFVRSRSPVGQAQSSSFVNRTRNSAQSTFVDGIDLQTAGPSRNVAPSSGVALDGDDENGLPQIYLSLHMCGNKLGAAYYDVSTSVLYLMPDIVETTDYHFLKQLFAQVGPHSIITSSKQKEAFIEFLQQTEYQEKVEILPHKGFNFELCKQRIYGLNGLGNLTEDSSDEERSIFFSSIVTQNNFSMVCAAGGLLKYVDQTLLTMELEEPGTAHVPVLLLKTFTLSNLLFVDQSTYSALQIFHKEWHPSVYKSFGEGKEGLSLFGTKFVTATDCQIN